MIQRFRYSTNLKRRGVRIFCFLTMCLVVALGAEAGLWDSQKKTVVLDPGHGGQDAGMMEPGASAEKTIALSFTRMMEAELKDTFRLVLTRTDDYTVEVQRRTGTANHEKASLFISIHTPGGLFQEKLGIDLFCFDASFSLQALEGRQPAAAAGSSSAPRRWDDLQAGHQAECRVLAEMLKETIHRKHGLPVRIHQVPLLVLKGADMPAILIEIGRLTPPDDEKRVQNLNELAALARTVSDAVVDYLK